VNSPDFHQVFKFHQVFTQKKLGEFTRFSPGFQISPSFHQKKNLVNSPGFHQVFKFHQVFTKKKLGEFTRFSPGFQISPSFHQKKMVNSPGFHQVFKFHQVFTPPKKKVNSPGFHQVFTRFSNFTKFSPKKHLVNSLGFFTRSFIRFWKFTRFPLSFHQVFQFFLPSMGDQSGGVRIESSFHCSDGRYVILKQAFFWHHFQEKTQEAFYTLS